MEPYFPYERCGGNINVELDASSYSRKADLKGATDIVTSALAPQVDLT